MFGSLDKRSYYLLRTYCLFHGALSVINGVDRENTVKDLSHLFFNSNSGSSGPSSKNNILENEDTLLQLFTREALELAGGKEQAKGQQSQNHLLKSIFCSISGIKEGIDNSVRPSYYSSLKLDPTKFIYPEFDRDMPELAADAQQVIAQNLISRFKEIASIKSSGINEDILLTLLEENLSLVPAGKDGISDISVYEQTKTTCAIASCLYKYHENELETTPNAEKKLTELITNRSKDKYLLIGGDFSGIQDFIYTISSKGALKLLRGRSFYLEILCEDVLNKLLMELELSRANILYAGGGNFFILAYNTSRAKEIVKNIEREIEDWLVENKLSSTLYLALSTIEISGEDFSDLSEIWREIYSRNSKKKTHKYRSKLKECPSSVLELSSGGDSCSACKRLTDTANLKRIDPEDEAEFCPMCREQFNIGKKLAKYGDSFVIAETHSKDFDLSVPFSKLKLLSKNDSEGISDTNQIYSVNCLDVQWIIDLIRAKKLDPDVKVSAIPIAVYCAKTENETKEYEIVEFEELAARSTGSEKLGALRMDVDNLGKIFSRGLPKQNRNITRIAALSRMMNYFFKAYLNQLGHFNQRSLIDTCNEQNEYIRTVNARNPERNFNIIYAGGDDLFVIGSWDDVFELSFDIEAAFTKYVGKNPHLTISAGFSIFDNKHPLYQIARTCGKKEQCSKDEGRNRIFMLDRGIAYDNISKNISNNKIEESVEWPHARKLFRDFKPVFNYLAVEKGESSRATIWKLLSSRDAYCADPQRMNWLIQLHYYIARNRDLKEIIEHRDNSELRKYFYSISDRQINPIYDIDLPLNILNLRERR